MVETPQEPVDSPQAGLRREIHRDLQDIRNAAGEDEGAGPFALLSMRCHPLVSIARSQARRRNRPAAAACFATPLVFLFALWILPTSPWTAWLPPGAGFRSVAAGSFAALWPLAMVLAAAWRATSAVLAERAQETALHLVLTPIPKRAIAAAKVLPHVRPFLWGIVAAAPVYALAGSLEALQINDYLPSPLVAWPLRLLLPILGEERFQTISLAGCLAGALMAVTDLGLVWVAAQWGAGLAVRTASLPMTAIRVLLRVLLLGLAFLFYSVLAVAVGLLAYPIGEWLMSKGEISAVTLAVSVFLALWWIFPLRNAARSCLEDFAWFDRLALDPADMVQDGRTRASDSWWYDGQRF